MKEFLLGLAALYLTIGFVIAVASIGGRTNMSFLERWIAWPFIWIRNM